MENINWEKDTDGVLHMYVDVAQLCQDEDDFWILNSEILGFNNCGIEFDEAYNEEEAKAYVEGFWNSDDGRKDDF